MALAIFAILLPLLCVLWAIAVARGIFRARRGVRQLRGLSRRHRGLCPVCGYDLRATPNRCPECGTPVAPT